MAENLLKFEISPGVKMGVKAGQARRGNTAWLVLHLLIYKKFILKKGKDDIKKTVNN